VCDNPIPRISGYLTGINVTVMLLCSLEERVQFLVKKFSSNFSSLN
jgi:hypothetical protein